MLNHGISTGALFILVGMIYERTHSREIAQYGGLAAKMPIFAAFFLIVTFSSIAVPMTNGFVGEFLILLGAFSSARGYAVFALLGVILSASYMLWAYKRIFFGTAGSLLKNLKSSVFVDLSLREICVLVPIVILIFWMGLFPNNFLDYSKESVEYLANNFESYELSIDSGITRVADGR